MNTLAAKWFIDAIKGAGGEAETGNEGRSASLLMEGALARALGLPDYCELSLEANDETMPGITPELLDKCAAVFSDRGNAATGAIRVDPSFVWPSDKKAEGFFKLTRGKSTFHGTTVTDQTYIAGYGTYSAVSDEKREGIVSAAVNADTGTIALSLGSRLEDLIEENRIEPWEAEIPAPTAQTLSTLSNVLRSETVRLLGDFDAVIARRLDRDCDRIYRYYKELMDGAVRVTGRKKTTVKEQEDRLDAIRREHAKKVDDLRVKYLMKVEITPSALLAVRLPCVCARYTVQMGNASREIAIPWNALTSRPDVTVCERCGGPAETVRLCREFHWLCRQCWRQCAACGKEYCPVCKPKGCSHG